MRFRARAGPAAPPPGLRELHDSCALLVAESWRETAQLYEDEVRALEEALRRGQESRLEAEEEARLCAREAEALRGQALELERLRERLEDELRRLHEEHWLQAEEHQRAIDCLEEEKEALTLAMAERLRDYQELVQVKTGLSLEVATYRALLEGESNPEILIWTEHIENMPQDFRKTSYQYTDSVLQRKNERNLFPKQNAPLGGLNESSTAYSVGHVGSEKNMSVGSTVRRGFLASGSPASATARHKDVYEETVNSQASSRTFSPTPGLVRNTGVQVRTFLDKANTEGTRGGPTYGTKASTGPRESSQDRWDSVTTDASASTRSNERTVILGKKTEAKATREQERDRSGAIKVKAEEKMFDSKEKASEERNLRWEELTKLDKETRKRESQQMRGWASGRGSLKEDNEREREIPVSQEVSEGSRSDASPEDTQTPGKKDTSDSPGSKTVTRETRFRLDARDAAGVLQGDSTTETIAENIVTSILKQFTQPSEGEAPANSFPDTKVTYIDRKELPGERTTKTEIVVESKLTEDIDVSDEARLDYLLSKDVKEVGRKGKSTEQMIGDIINLGLKGREGRAKVVNVEIVEEPMSYVGGRRTEEFSTPFRVEELDDVSPSSRGLVEEEGADGEARVSFSLEQRPRTKQAPESVSHVEEVTEAGDSGGEQSYFVSTPDEYPEGPNREDEGSVYGQVHIEEESTIRYSWQDEIVQGTWRRRRRDDEAGEGDVKAVDVPAHSPGADLGSARWKEEASGEFHAEPTVIEKEIKIPHEFHTSIRGTFSKEPREQLAEVIGRLEETLPERMKAELSALTAEGQGEPGSVSVDVKKLQSEGGGSVTLMAEVNLSQTVDASQLDLEELSRDEADEIEKAVESVVRESLAKQHSRAPGSPGREDGGVSFKRWETRELYHQADRRDDAIQASGSPEEPTARGPVSATVEVSSPPGFMRSHVLEDVSRPVRHVNLGPAGVWRTEHVSSEGPSAGLVEVSEGQREAAGVRGASRSVRHFTVGPAQSQAPTEVIGHGPGSQEPGDTEEPGLAELPTDSDSAGSCSALGTRHLLTEKEINFQGPVSGAGRAGDYFATEEPVSAQISVRHLQLSPKEGFREQIQFILPPPDKVEGGTGGDSVGTDDPAGHSGNGPQGHQATEQVVSWPVGSSNSGDPGRSEGSADVSQAPHTYTSGRTILMTQKSTFQKVVSESPQEHNAGDMSGTETASGISRSFRHIQLEPTETTTSKHIVIHGPVSRTFALAGSEESPEPGRPAPDSRSQTHLALGPKETSFTFQMDVSSRQATATWTQEAGTEAEAHSGSDRGAWREADSRKDRAAGVSSQASAAHAVQARREEDAGFDKTVQLQRMVDQRSVISDEKKVALLYLDSEEEESDGQWF